LPTGDRPGVASAAVLEFDEPEASLGVDLADADRSGVRAVRIKETCRLAADAPRATLALIRLLREAASHGTAVSWRGRVGAGIDVNLLVHLPPPDPPVDADAATADVSWWRERYRPGLCYYRLGPDFALVKDVRSSGAAARFRLDSTLHVFRSLEAIVDVNGLDPVATGVLEDLEREALALRLGNLATLLPSRMRRWPVPALEV
jgi:Family of unknown function (DUF5825)